MCPPTPPPPSVSSPLLHAHADAAALERIATLEAELRRAKRAEQKLQAMLYRLRKDVEGAAATAATAGSGHGPAPAGGQQPAVVLGLEAFEKLRDIRSLEYDVDMLGQKAKVRVDELDACKRPAALWGLLGTVRNNKPAPAITQLAVWHEPLWHAMDCLLFPAHA